MRGDEITEFRNQDSPRYIYQIMLLGKLCGHADQYRKDTGKCFVPDRNLFALSNSDKTEPAYHTMYRRKQICRGVKGINQTHEPAKKITAVYLGPYIRRGHPDKKYNAE